MSDYLQLLPSLSVVSRDAMWQADPDGSYAPGSENGSYDEHEFWFSDDSGNVWPVVCQQTIDLIAQEMAKE